MKRNVLFKVRAYISEKELLEKDDHVVVGVSGGADSICLFLLLCELKEEYRLKIECVCVDHGIRSEAREELEYVRSLCEERQIPFHPYFRDVRKIALETGISEEEAGRNERYKAFYEVLDKTAATKIAVAHNSGDNAETMIFNFFRGSSITGLSGISPKRGEIIRPVLLLERSEIEEYVREAGVRFYTDATNETDDYTRNRIRHNIIPYAEQEISGNIREKLLHTAENLREIDDFLMTSVTEAEERCKAGEALLVPELKKLHVAVLKKLIYLKLAELSPGRKDISATYVDSVIRLLDGTGSKSIDLAFGITVVREYDLLYIRKNAQREKKRGVLRLLSESESKKVIESGEYLTSQFIKYLDYDKINSQCEFRKRLPGDYICVRIGEKIVEKSLKTVLINDKVPLAQREEMLFPACGSEILLVPGGRINERLKITEKSSRILEVSYE